MIDYTDYIARKLSTVPSTGIAGDVALPASMFPHQRILTAWAIKRGRAAIFADTGLGKSRMQLAWADAVQRHTRKPVLILAPLGTSSTNAGRRRSWRTRSATTWATSTPQRPLTPPTCRRSSTSTSTGTDINYYEHHLGDYDGATAHLSWLEDCAYRRMLGLYYRTEAPLPADPKQVCRLVRATSKPERDAVQQVLTEFFELADDGWHNARCDEDVASYHELEPEREAKRENAKERQRRARARRAELFETLRGHNIVPPYDTTTRALEALLSRVTSALPVTEPVTPVTCDDTATHTHLPPPTSQTQITPTEVKGKAAARPRPPDRPDDVASGVWDDWLQLRRAKKAPVTATVLDGARGEAVKAGLTLEAFLRVWCSRGSQGLQAEWLKPHERGRSAATPDEPEWRREQRERTAEFAGPAAAKRPPETVDVETINADARIVG